MERTRKRPLSAFAAGVVVTLLILLLTALFVVYTGSYNVAASEGHTPVVRWAFTRTMENAVKDEAAEIQAPQITNAMIEEGAAEYKAMCQHCHAGPGVEHAEWSEGILPQPPHLVEAAAEWEPNEVFWLVKHGLKMTAMPAFGSTHDDDTLWSIAAFVKELPGMTAQEYAAFESEPAGQHAH